MDRISRRRFLRDAGVASAALASGARPARAAGVRRAPTVAVFGGGIAGLTAAHELAERGFAVTVYERRAWGGKARSTEVPQTAAGGRKPLPGEHSWRLFAGFYQNTSETMRRIPFGSNPNGVFDNLVATDEILFAREGARRGFVFDFRSAAPRRGLSPLALVTLLSGAMVDSGVPPQALEHFVSRFVVFLSSCDARRHGQWEHTTWTDFIGADRYGDDYHKIIGKTFSQVVQASRAERTSALFPCHIFELCLYNTLGEGANGPLVRHLDRPTNEAFIDPWLALLRKLGVRLRVGHEVTGLDTRDGRIVGARIRHRGRSSTVTAHWYVCATPVEHARRLWNRDILAADPHLGRMWKLDTAWMNGLKFFLSKETPIVPGHVFYVDSPWLVTSVSQAQYWPLDFAATYGDGRTHESLSAIISDWTAPGVLYGKPATECSEAQVAAEVWEQMKRHLNKPGSAPVLTDDLLLSCVIDQGMLRRNGRLVSEDPLVLPTVGQGPDRPDVTTQIPNLILCGDYLKSDLEVANMETASFNGRRAANAVIERSGSHQSPCRAIPSYRPPEWEPLKRIDEDRYRRGQPNLFDTEMSRSQMAGLLERAVA